MSVRDDATLPTEQHTKAQESDMEGTLVRWLWKTAEDVRIFTGDSWPYIRYPDIPFCQKGFTCWCKSSCNFHNQPSDHWTACADSDASLPSDLVLLKGSSVHFVLNPWRLQLCFVFLIFHLMIFSCASSAGSHSFLHISLFLSDNQFITSRTILSRAQNIQYKQHSTHSMYFPQI